jgi:hypothetical protein
LILSPDTRATEGDLKGSAVSGFVAEVMPVHSKLWQDLGRVHACVQKMQHILELRS